MTGITSDKNIFLSDDNNHDAIVDKKIDLNYSFNNLMLLKVTKQYSQINIYCISILKIILVQNLLTCNHIIIFYMH